MHKSSPVGTLLPIYLTRTATYGGNQLTGQIHNPTGDASIQIVRASGEIFTVPYDLLDGIMEAAEELKHQIVINRENLRKENIGPATNFGLTLKTNDDQQSMLLPQANPGAMGTPKIIWISGTHLDPSSSGWELGITGAPNVRLGFARWDDPAAVREFVTIMKDPVALHALAGLIAPDALTLLTSRMNASALRASGAPEITLKEAKTILLSAGLGRQNSTACMGLLALLRVSTAPNRVLPVAISVIAPTHEQTRDFTAHERFHLNDQELHNVNARIAQAALTKWRTAAINAFEEAGWRIVELPEPALSSFGLNSVRTALWVTRINEASWETIRAAVTERAPLLNAYTGTNF